ncbi:MAG: hypothetical protein ACR2LE_04295 [Nocardioidaceae bacterium]
MGSVAVRWQRRALVGLADTGSTAAPSGRASSAGVAKSWPFRGSDDGRAWWGVAAAVLLSIALRIPFVGAPAYPDEGGYLLVAHDWHPGGPALYGDYFVDRPPLLMVFWHAGDAWGGIQTARWLACGLVAVLVVAAAWAGRLIGGNRAAVWSAFTAAALASTPVLGAYEVDGELLAVPLVMVTCALAIAAVRSRDAVRQAFTGASLGVTGACALLVKQNFVDALVFAVVLVAVSALQGSLPLRAALRVLGSAIAGVAVVSALTLVWASTTRPGPSGLMYAMYGFRSDASQVIFSQSLSAPLTRLETLLEASVRSGVLIVVIVFVACKWSSMRRFDPLSVAVTAMLAVGLAEVGLGGSYWVHYLIGLVPVLALAAGTLSGRTLPLRRMRFIAIAFVMASAISTSAVASGASSSTQVTETALESVLQAASHRGDTVVITYGHANVIQASGLAPGYGYLWSLPMRTLDPQLNLLTKRLSGRTAPTWLMEWEDFDSWGIDAGGRLASTVQTDYRRVATVCGVKVFLHVGVKRAIPANADSCAH